MSPEQHSKVQPRHLKRAAFLYVRQSTIRQVFENSESTKRQYDLRQRAISLGWAVEQVVIIDDDLGQSGSSSTERGGFQRLVTEVGLGRAGIVMGLEVSRLARNSTDWHRLIEICAITDTLILDEDGIYDPAHFNDRLLLGLKGTMSEAELHVLRARLRGGLLNKARRGELDVPLPVGFVYDPAGRVVLDPDIQVQESVRSLFRTFNETGSAMATVRAFRDRSLKFPRRVSRGGRPGELAWKTLDLARTLWVLHNPRYAGAFCFGRTKSHKRPGGGGSTIRLPREEWTVLLQDVHVGYIGWEQYEENQRRLVENSHAYSVEHRTPPREGSALLQGIAICGICGQRMIVRYHVQNGRRIPQYCCETLRTREAGPICQHVPGAIVDERIGELLLEEVTPQALGLAIAVQEEVQTRIAEADRLRARQVERAVYEAELARRRYMQVDPDNRLVADVLEAAWNECLRAVADAKDAYEAHRKADRVDLMDGQRARILDLAADFPRLWKDPATPDRERKRILRLLVEDVTLIKNNEINVFVRFRGGSTRTLVVPRPLPAPVARKTVPELVREIDELLGDHTIAEIVAILNEKGMRTGTGQPMNFTRINCIRLAYKLGSRYERLRARGLLTTTEVGQRLGIEHHTVANWRRVGLLVGHRYNDRGDCLYEEPDWNSPKLLEKKSRMKRTESPCVAHVGNEVQYEA